MFGLFKEREKLEDNKPTKEQVNKLIEKIHNEFQTEVDRILAEAKISVPEIPIDENLLNRANRLRAIGFHSAKEIQEVRDWERRNQENKWKNDRKRQLVDAVNYFSEKYPNYKFITKDRVLAICEKYNLHMGPVRNFTGDVPDENIRVMEVFEIEEGDKASEEIGTMPRFTNFNGSTWDHRLAGLQTFYGPAGLQICAPLSQFNKDGLAVDQKTRTLVRKVEIPDPVVLQPVNYKGETYYLVVTAWGIESEDSELK